MAESMPPIPPAPSGSSGDHDGDGSGHRPDAKPVADKGEACEQRKHGRQARWPHMIPYSGWRDILWRVYNEIGRDHVTIMAAGVAFYALLSIVPAIAAMVSIYGLISDPADVRSQIAALGPVLPREVRRFLVDQLSRAIDKSSGALGISALTSILLSIWSANRGTKALITAINVAYEEKEERGIVAQNVFGLLFTLGAIVGTLVALGAVVLVPTIMGYLGLSEEAEATVSLLRWPLLFVVVIIGIGLLYSLGPTRKRPRLRWVSWGSVIATSLWLLSSVLFSLYISYFGSFDETYGSLGAVVILLLWFFVSALVIILGAEINAEMEHQTCMDSTVGEDRPMGERGAYVADHVGPGRK